MAMRLLAAVLAYAAVLLGSEPLTQTFEQAVKALSAQDYAAAEAGFQKVLASFPNHAGALQNLGLVYSRTGRPEQAATLYRRALARRPEDKSLLMNLGLVYLKQEAYGEAAPVFERLVSIDPGSLPARELLATSRFYIGQIPAAIGGFEAARREDSGNPDLLFLLAAAYLKQDQSDRARGVLEECAASAPPAVAQLVSCRAFGEAERFGEAAEHCRKALELDPKLPGVHRAAGKVMVGQHDPDAAAELSAAVAQDPADAEALYLYGVALLQAGRLPEATDALERAAKLHPGFWGNYFYLGKAKLQLNRAEEAVPLLRKAAELNARGSVVWYELGRALTAAGKPDDARAAMQRVRDLRAEELQSDARALRKP